MRHRYACATAIAAASLVLPATAPAEPNGQGLDSHSAESCVPDVGTQMLRTPGRSLWIGDGHYIIHSFTFDGTPYLGQGEMDGIATRGTVNCTGTDQGVITSVDYLVK